MTKEARQIGEKIVIKHNIVQIFILFCIFPLPVWKFT